MKSGNTKSPVPAPLEYAEEVLCANWNPLASMPAESPAHAQEPALENVDVETFLARLYQSQRA